MIDRVLTGGQTGADQAGWRAARAAGIATGGAMPRGFLTEEGPRPEFEGLYGAVALDSDRDEDRTRANVSAADAALVFVADPPGPGTRLTLDACEAARVPYRFVEVDRPPAIAAPEHAAAWLAAVGARTLLVAGDRESTRPGIGADVEAYLLALFPELNRTGSQAP